MNTDTPDCEWENNPHKATRSEPDNGSGNSELLTDDGVSDEADEGEDQLHSLEKQETRTMTEDHQEHSDLWKTSRDAVESDGGDWDEHRKQALATINLNNLRKAAAVVESLTPAPSMGKDELTQELTKANCFLGPIGDETIYQERDGEAVPIAGRRGIPSHKRWVVFKEVPKNAE